MKKKNTNEDFNERLKKANYYSMYGECEALIREHSKKENNKYTINEKAIEEYANELAQDELTDFLVACINGNYDPYTVRIEAKTDSKCCYIHNGCFQIPAVFMNYSFDELIAYEYILTNQQ